MDLFMFGLILVFILDFRFENGFETHEIAMGPANGKLAKAGKSVVVAYVGKLKTGKVL